MTITTTITVAKVIGPRPDKKRGTVEAIDGTIFGAMPDKLVFFQPGGTYAVQYREDEFRGRTYKVVEAVTPVGGVPLAQNGRQPMPMPQPTAAAPAPRYGSTDDKTAERIFVCGALNACLSNPNTNPSDLTDDKVATMVTHLRKAYARTLGGQPTIRDQRRDEMDDEIPGFN